MPQTNQAQIAYILKGFPRLTETFISNEIYLLEQLGTKLVLFSIKPGELNKQHEVIQKIKSPLTYLPSVTSLSGSYLLIWVLRNIRPYLKHHANMVWVSPGRYFATFRKACALAWQHRNGFLRLRKVFIKEFIQAGFIANQIQSRPNILLLHAHFCHGATTVAWFVSQMTGLPFSFTAHAKDIYQKQLNPGRLLEQKLAAAQFVTTCTKTNHDYLTALHDENCPIHAVYHGINTKKFIPRTNYQLNVGQPLILAVGRHVEKKGFVYLIEACAKLHLANIDFQCLIIGESGDQTDVIKTTIQNKKLESRVVLRNAVTQEELRELYQQATIFALPCVITKDGDRDGIPNVMAEAMATGLPIVSTPISGIPELVEDQVNGLLVPPRDVEGLAGALKLLLADEMLRHKLGKAARQTICEQFDATVTIRSLQQLFQQALTYSKQHKPDNE